MIDAWAIKVDGNGNKLWQRTFGGSGEEAALEIKSDNNGGYIMCGNTKSNDGDMKGNHGLTDAWILKLLGLNL